MKKNIPFVDDSNCSSVSSIIVSCLPMVCDYMEPLHFLCEILHSSGYIS